MSDASPRMPSAAPRIGLPLLVLLVLVLLMLPAVLPARSYWMQLLFTVFVFAVMGHAWNLLAGFCGLLSFGNQVYIGLGGFAMAIAFYYGGLPIWVAWLFSGLAGLAFAWLLAVPRSERFEGRGVRWPLAIAIGLWIVYELAIATYPALDVFGSDYVRRVAIVLLIFLGALPLLRLQGPYFAIATWLVAESVASVFNEWKLVGAGGGMQVKTDVSLVQLYYAALALLIVMTAAIWRLLRSRYGVGLTAVRDDEEAAQTVGVDVRQVKMVVFLIGGLFTGLAAGLFYMDTVIITPPSGFALSWSAYLVFIVVAGGMGTLPGPIIGAVVYVIIDRLLAASVGGGLLVLGVSAILLMFFLPRGIMGIVTDLRQGPGAVRHDFSGWRRLWRAVIGESSLKSAELEQPGVVAAFLVPGSPLPLLRPDAPPYEPVVQAMTTVRRRLEEIRPDTLLIYSTQWIAVLDQLWQTRPRMSGLQVDENWHELGTLRFDLRSDTSLARACVKGCIDAGISARAVDYDHFPIDIGTISVNAQINPQGQIPVVIAANNLYHDWDTTRKLGEIAVGCAIEQGKRVAIIAIGGLSGTTFRDERPFESDAIAGEADDGWNRQVLAKIEAGQLAELLAEIPLYVRDARVDMGFKHFAWLLGALGGELKGASVLGYGPAYGSGAAVIEFRV
jgi:ABC-type branched-subunit amino acid transport system permease subunit/aromatic ring-opening dioxygenase catalytic subunit (LigB family)